MPQDKKLTIYVSLATKGFIMKIEYFHSLVIPAIFAEYRESLTLGIEQQVENHTCRRVLKPKIHDKGPTTFDSNLNLQISH